MTAGDLGRSAIQLTRTSAFRFLVVGGTSVVVDAGLLYVLHGQLGLWLPLATALSFLAGFVVNFALNRQWAFSSTGRLRTHLVRYVALVAVNLLATVGLVQVITSAGVPYLLAKVVTTACVSVVNYVVSKKWIFT